MPIFVPPPFQPIAETASVFLAVRYDRTKSGANRFAVLPNVLVESVHIREGAHWPTAQFSYILHDAIEPPVWPAYMEDLWPLGASGPYIVQLDDEILIYEFVDTGDRTLYFDGFAQIPQVNIGPGGQKVTFTAISVHARLWDTPIKNAVIRDSDEPMTGDSIVTGRPVWFNPGNRPNRTPIGGEVDPAKASKHHVFLDPQTPIAAAPPTPAFWTLADFCRYVMWTANAKQEFIDNLTTATGVDLDDYLVAAAPIPPATTMDLTNPKTYTTSPITIRSYDASGKTLPEALAEQLGYYGFHLFLSTEENPFDPGAPYNDMLVYRIDGRDGNAPEYFFYPGFLSSIETNMFDFNVMGLSRDGSEIVNEIEIESNETEYEASFVLAPGFKIHATTDLLDITEFDQSKVTGGITDRNLYRYFIFDEAGSGHWDFTTGTWFVGVPSSLDAILGKPDAAGDPVYATRPRKPEGTLFAVDAYGNALRADLSVSRDYAGKSPAIWDGTGTWTSLGQSGWKLDEHTLGIRITAQNPENWQIPKGTNAAFGGDSVRLVTSLAQPDTYNPRVYFRLTCRFSGDKGISALAARRTASPTKYAIQRRIDSRDHWKKHVQCKSSAYNKAGVDDVIRDDTPLALAHAQALRLYREFPRHAGQVRAPWITRAPGVGDLIDEITGRAMNLQTNAGTPAGEGPRYPAVVGMSWTCQNPHSTTWELADSRAESEVQNANSGYAKQRG